MYTNVLDLLKNLSEQENKHLFLIADKTNLDEISTHLPLELITDILDRPLDISLLIFKIKALLDEEQQEMNKKNILLVDDDVSFLMLLKEWLSDKYHVGLAKSGMQAILWLARNKVDLIFLDYNMPIVSGPLLFEMLKNEDYSKDIPVMFLTGTSDKESIMKVMGQRPAGYMLKDITKEALLSYVDKYFENNSSGT